jgi:predicted phosphodiesterase
MYSKIFVLFGIVISVLLIGCANNMHLVQSQKSISIQSDFNISRLSSEIILVSDTQEHESTGTATFEESQFVDKNIANVTIRTAQANIGVLPLLTKILDKNKSIIHLGDYLDVSCLDEFDRFEKVMSKNQNLVALIGNHDGYYVGNYLSKDDMEHWSGRCDAGREYNITKENINRLYENNNSKNRLLNEYKKFLDNNLSNKTSNIRVYNKATVIERYLAKKLNNNGIIFDNNDTFHNSHSYNKIYNSTKIPGNISGNFKYIRTINYTDVNTTNFLYKIYAKVNQCDIKSDLNNCNPQRSFLLQQVRVEKNEKNNNNKKINMILIDTSVYNQACAYKGPFYAMCNSDCIAGKKGEVSEEQIIKIDEWIKENNENNITTIFAGHHPLHQVKQLNNYFKSIANQYKKPIFYISGHTHQGYWEQKDNVTELNIGSLIDFPIQYRTLQLADIDGDLKIYSKLHELDKLNISSLTNKNCKQEWIDYSNNRFLDIKYQKSHDNMGYFISKHLSLAPHLEYYYKLIKDNNIQDLNISFFSSEHNRTESFDNEELLSYMKNSLDNFENYFEYIENENKIGYFIDNNNSCITNKGTLSTQDCSRLLFKLRSSEKLFEKKYLDYHICSLLNASEEDAKNTKVSNRDCTLYDCSLDDKFNRQIEKLILKFNTKGK